MGAGAGTRRSPRPLLQREGPNCRKARADQVASARLSAV